MAELEIPTLRWPLHTYVKAQASRSGSANGGWVVFVSTSLTAPDVLRFDKGGDATAMADFLNVQIKGVRRLRGKQ